MATATVPTSATSLDFYTPLDRVRDAGSFGAVGKGVDATRSTQMALEPARDLARDTGALVAMTGVVDYVTDGERVVAIHNGHPMMARVTGLGCTATALVGAFLGAND